MLFAITKIIFALSVASLLLLVAYLNPKHPKLSTIIPRHKIAGVILISLALIWTYFLTIPLLPASMSGIKHIIIAIIPVLAILSYIHLDYLFARGLGGLTILASNHIIHEGFAHHLPFRAIFSLVCYLLAIFAFVLICTPWRFRDLLELTAQKIQWRTITSAILAICTLILSIYVFL